MPRRNRSETALSSSSSEKPKHTADVASNSEQAEKAQQIPASKQQQTLGFEEQLVILTKRNEALKSHAEQQQNSIQELNHQVEQHQLCITQLEKLKKRCDSWRFADRNKLLPNRRNR